jgi:hypothetical protein
MNFLISGSQVTWYPVSSIEIVVICIQNLSDINQKINKLNSNFYANMMLNFLSNLLMIWL